MAKLTSGDPDRAKNSRCYDLACPFYGSCHPGWEYDQALLLPENKTFQMMVPQTLLDDFAGMNDLIGKALRGEIELRPVPEPPRHRCMACWLAALLPGHDRCRHGYLTCGRCEMDV